MKKRRARRFVTGILAVFATLANADAQTARYCEIAMEFSVDGKRIAAPSAIVEFGKEAEVTIGDETSHAWRLRILAEEPTIVRRAGVIPVSVDLYEVAEGKEYLRASPHVNLAPGQRADLEAIFGEGDGRRARIAVVANLRSDAEVQRMTGEGDAGSP